MGNPLNQPVRRRRLGNELRRLREAVGLTGDEVARLLFCSVSKISRMETGDRGVSPRDLRELLDLYGVTDGARRAELAELTQRPTEPGWWQQYRQGDSSDLNYIELEDAASSAWRFETHLVSGLFQTEEYARHLFDGWTEPHTEEDVQRAVALRMGRQRLLVKDPALIAWHVIDESALHRTVGTDHVMRRQMERLLDVIALPNMTLQVLPLKAGPYPDVAGPFAVMRFDQDDLGIVYRDGPPKPQILSRREDVDLSSRIFQDLALRALDPGRTAAVINEVRMSLS